MGVGSWRHRVTFEAPQTVPDGEGGYINGWAPLGPAWDVEIRPATVMDLERRAAGTVIAAATHIVNCRYRADVTVHARMMYRGREFRIAGIRNIDQRNIEMDLFVIETVS